MSSDPRPYEPELGQSLFGNPYGPLDCPEYLLQALLDVEQELTAGNDDSYHSPFQNSSLHYQNDTFQVHAYYWGGCACGWDGMQPPYRHTPECFSNRVRAYTEELSQRYRILIPEYIEALDAWCKANGYTGWEGSAAHCDCGYDALVEQWFEEHKLGPYGHAESCPTVRPNFKWRDLEVRWYKHVRRGPSVNRPITREEVEQLRQECLTSIPENPVIS